LHNGPVLVCGPTTPWSLQGLGIVGLFSRGGYGRWNLLPIDNQNLVLVVLIALGIDRLSDSSDYGAA